MLCNLHDESKEFIIGIKVRPFLGDESQPENRQLVTFKSTKRPGTSVGNTRELIVTEMGQLSVRGKARQKEQTFQGDFIINESINPVNEKIDNDTGDDTGDDGENLRSLIESVMLPRALDGGISTIFAYGQTNSGKTFTIREVCESIGKQLFHSAPLVADNGLVKVTANAFEILGQTCTDLLDPERKRISIMEDRIGSIQLVNCLESELISAAEFNAFIESVFSGRKTSATFKNDTSSRSHCVIRLKFTMVGMESAEPGVFYVVDLAGSERASKDSINHSAEQRKESIEINKSLMNLKECILRRSGVNSVGGSAGQTGSTANHIPYRSSKLTLCLKDSFELTRTKPSCTLMIATVSPLADDLSASVNTLRYAQALLQTPKRSGSDLESPLDPGNPATWTNAQVLDWFKFTCSTLVPNVENISPVAGGWTGLQLCRVPEAEFIRRLINASNGKMGEKRAKAIYLELWRLIVDARTRTRKLEKERWKRVMVEKRKQEEEFNRELAASSSSTILENGGFLNRNVIRF